MNAFVCLYWYTLHLYQASSCKISWTLCVHWHKVCSPWTLIRCIFIVTKCTVQCNLNSDLLCLKHNRIRQQARRLYKPSSKRYKVSTCMNVCIMVSMSIYTMCMIIIGKKLQKCRTSKYKGVRTASRMLNTYTNKRIHNWSTNTVLIHFVSPPSTHFGCIFSTILIFDLQWNAHSLACGHKICTFTLSHDKQPENIT
jgi:hypothetical protein